MYLCTRRLTQLGSMHLELQKKRSVVEEAYFELHGRYLELKVSNLELQKCFKNTEEEVSCMYVVSHH